MVNNLKDFAINEVADPTIKNGTSNIIKKGFVKNATISSNQFNTYIKMMVNFLKGIFNEDTTSTIKITEKTTQNDFKQAFKDLFNLTENSNIKPHIQNVVNSIYPQGSVYINGSKETFPTNPFKSYVWRTFNLGSYNYAYFSINNIDGGMGDISGETQYKYYINTSHTHSFENPIVDKEVSFQYPTIDTKLDLTYVKFDYNETPAYVNYWATSDENHQEITYGTSIDYNVNYTDNSYSTAKNTPINTQTSDTTATYTENLKHINCYAVYLS